MKAKSIVSDIISGDYEDDTNFLALVATCSAIDPPITALDIQEVKSKYDDNDE